MDPVSKLLDEREARRPGMWPWVVAATLLHGSVIGAILLVGRNVAARPSHLPAVSVKLIRPQRPPARRAPTSRPQPTAAPATAAPTVLATPRPTAAPLEASDDAMPAADRKATPAAEPAPEPEPAGGATGSGLSVGDATPGEISGIPGDFQFTYYVERMLSLIEVRWFKPAAAPGAKARVRFTIMQDGRLESIALELSSGLPSFDRAALRALYAANPLPPLPPAYGKPSLTVHLTFTG